MANGPVGSGAALALAWRIEGHAAECVLTRPTLFGDARRRLLARFRPELSIGYLLDVGEGGGPRLLAFARCLVGDANSAREVSALRFSRALDASDRVRVAEALPFEVRWREEPCEPATCGRRALTMTAPDTLMIEGAAREGVDTSQPDVRRLLAAEVAAHPETFEASVQRVGRSSVVVFETLERARRGVLSRRRVSASGGQDGTLRTDAALRGLLARGRTRATARYLDQHAGPMEIGADAEQVVPLPWSVIEVSVADLALEQRTRLRRAARDRVVAFREIDLDATEVVRRQAAARALAARVAHDPAQRRAWLDERARLLTQLFLLTDEVPALIEAVEVRRALGEPDAAHALALEAWALAPDHPGVRALTIETAPSLEALAAQLARVRPELDLAARTELAGGVLAAAESNVDFATVEASFATVRAGAPVAAVPVPGAIELSRSGLVEAVYLLLRASDPGRDVDAGMALRLEGTLRSDAPRGHRGVAVRWPPRGRDRVERWATVVSPDTSLAQLRALSALLEVQLPRTGDVRLSAWLGEGERGRAVSVRLDVAPGSVRLIAASRAATEAVWLGLARDALRPALGLEATRFPPPTLRVALAEPLRSRVLVRVGEHAARIGGRCEVDADALVCVGDGRGPDALLDVLAWVAAETIR